MLKKIRLLVFVSLVFLINFDFVGAYSVSSDNNPGSAHTAGTGSNATKGTNWGTPSHLQAVRIRIFRGSTVVKSGYYSLASSTSGCYSSVTGTLCETSSYNYSSVTSTSGVSCSSKTLSLGCIVGTNLNYSMYWDSGAKANGTYLDNYLKNSNYGNLKSLLEGMGYNNTNFSNDDVVIVEPVTSVICNGSKYFGTSTALMKKNVSYRGTSGNMCSGNDGYNGYTFQNVFRNMSKAFKVSTGTFGNSSYTGFGFFKYNVSSLGFVLPNYYVDLNGYLDSTIAYNIDGYGTADIYINGTRVANDVSDYYTQWPQGSTYEIKDIKAQSGKKYNGVHSGSISGTLTSDVSVYLNFSTNQGSLKIVKKDNHGGSVLGAKFNIYKGKNCNGTVLHNKKTVPGSLSLSLDSGDYSIKEVENNSTYYEAPDGACVNVTIKPGETVTKTFTNILSCDGELDYIKSNYTGDSQKQQLIKLYSKYSSKNGLLNFSNPSCTTVSCTNTPSAGCLSGNFTSTDISANNLSCHTNTITVGTDTAFCRTTLSATSAVGSGPFSAKSGQMYITSQTGKATTLTLGMKCYLYADSLNSTINGGSFTDYLSNVQFDGTEANPKHLSRGSNPTITLNRNGSTREYNGSFSVNYYFKKIYTNNGTGEVVEVNKNDPAPCRNCKFLGYGKISKLTDKYTNKSIPFKFTLKLNKITAPSFNSDCKVTTTPEIIINDKPRLVVRSVNSTSGNPFLNYDGSDRESGSNWKGYESIITNNNNSYNKNGATSPKYKITLTPSTIDAIRQYNKYEGYDNYDLTCKPTSVDANGEPLGTVCISNYLTTLRSNYGLEINNSKIRECFEGQNKNSATCSI